MKKKPYYFPSPWKVSSQDYDKNNPFYYGNVFLSGNGYLGFRGTFPGWRKDSYTACTVSDTYDMADGVWKELCNVPNGLFLQVYADNKLCDPLLPESSELSHGLSFFSGTAYGSCVCTRLGEPVCRVSWERFASMDSLHAVVQSVSVEALTDADIHISSGIDTDVWSLHGNHFAAMSCSSEKSVLSVKAVSKEQRIPIIIKHLSDYAYVSGSSCGENASAGMNTETATTSVILKSSETSEAAKAEKKDGLYIRNRKIWMKRGETVTINSYMSIYTGNDTENPEEAAETCLRRVQKTGYSTLKKQNEERWKALWGKYGIQIEGDREMEAYINYCSYHNIIAAPSHSDHLPIGARGLSCQGYQGAAFWDEEIYNLPMYIYTTPEKARSILLYRYNTLGGAKQKARNLGYLGAFYAWISGDTGEELCPSYFFKDVLTSRKIRNHFNDWQIHISPDITYVLWKYIQSTGDLDFVRDFGAEMAFEIAHFLYSRIHYNPAKKQYEILRVLGPDEYHENVDNNAFTNVQAAFALKTALKIKEMMGEIAPKKLQDLLENIGISDKEMGTWTDMVERLYIPQPDEDTKLIEQFDGYFSHEDITPAEAQERLIDLEEYWGWPNGVAFETQVIKQADVVQLFTLHTYPEDVVEKNFNYYEPRTQHRSSLSKGTHALAAARIGHIDTAYDFLLHSCKVDLDNTHPPTSGGTFIGGIHTAACGIAWQVMVMGFLNFHAERETVYFAPQLYPSWERISLYLNVFNHPFRVRCSADSLELISLCSASSSSSSSNSLDSSDSSEQSFASVSSYSLDHTEYEQTHTAGPLKCSIAGIIHILEPGKTLHIPLH